MTTTVANKADALEPWEEIHKRMCPLLKCDICENIGAHELRIHAAKSARAATKPPKPQPSDEWYRKMAEAEEGYDTVAGSAEIAAKSLETARTVTQEDVWKARALRAERDLSDIFWHVTNSRGYKGDAVILLNVEIMSRPYRESDPENECAPYESETAQHDNKGGGDGKR